MKGGRVIDREAFVATWSARDRERAPFPADHALIDAGTALRSKVAEFLLAGASDEELYDVCAVFGRAIADGDGSPTFASTTMDSAREVLATLAGADAPELAWVSPARAAVIEGYCAAVLERAHLEGLRSWDFPRCAVFVSDTRIAIAAGHPSTDPEILASWAARVANAAAQAGARTAIVAGTPEARAAVEDAFALVGILVP